jgi:hypothetical protein
LITSKAVYGELPSRYDHVEPPAFNLTDKDGKLEAWLNFDFVAPDAQLWPAQGIFNTDKIFKMAAPAFGKDYVCDFNRMPRVLVCMSSARIRTSAANASKSSWGNGAVHLAPRRVSPARPPAPDDFCGGRECVASDMSKWATATSAMP